MSNHELEWRISSLEKNMDCVNPGCFGALGIALFMAVVFVTAGSYWSSWKETDGFTKPAKWKEKNAPVEVDK